MAVVETVTGSVDAGDLGRVLMHEHVIHYSDHMRAQWPHLHDYEEAPVEVAVSALARAKQLGIDTVVDCSTPNMGRQVSQMMEVAERTGVNIVFSTGYHPMIGPEFYFKVSRGTGITANDLAEMFVHDIVEGAQGTGAKAGIIKVGTAPDYDAWQELSLRAAARAHRRTGVPITTHSEPARKDGLYQLDIFEEEGVDLRNVIIGHSGDSTDFAYLSALVERGCVLGMDRFGFMVETFLQPLSTAERIRIVKEMCDRGAVDRMVLSHDACVWCDYMPPEHIAQVNPEWNINYLASQVLPDMRAAGIGEDQLDVMLRTTPARLLTPVAPY